MKTKVITLLLSLLFLSSTSPRLIAQVTIGMGEGTVPGALLQLKTIGDATSAGGKNAEKGLVMPRVQLVKIDQLQPMYTYTDTQNTPSAEEEKSHKGMIVYNLTDTPPFKVGMYMWDGEKWQAFVNGSQVAEISKIDCGRAAIKGTYYAGTALNSSNYIEIPVTFDTEGSYNIIARTTNGYYFYATGAVETTGELIITLEGMGIPSVIGTDIVKFYINDKEYTTCTLSVDVKSSVISYQVDCDKIEVKGYYLRGEGIDAAHYAIIPIKIINYADGYVNITTPTMNGIYFSYTGTIDPGATEIMLLARGVPTAAGAYNYQFTTNGGIKTTCSFNVQVISDLGSFNNPAASCSAILQADATKADGEYFIRKDVNDYTPIKVFCDMTHGGYTMIWSYSEKTAYAGAADIYVYANNIEMFNNQQKLTQSKPRNLVENDESGTINYADYRLSLFNIKSARTNPRIGLYRVRICYNPTDMNDKWGEAMHLDYRPSSANLDVIEGTLDGQSLRKCIVDGKLFGLPFKSNGNGTTSAISYNGINLTNQDITLWNYSDYGSHFNADYGVFSGTPGASDQVTTTLPYHPDDVESVGGGNKTFSYTFAPRGFNNMFGWHGEYTLDHFFGRCGAATGDNYTNNMPGVNIGCTAANKRPHSFNNGEGRYLQWFVK